MGGDWEEWSKAAAAALEQCNNTVCDILYISVVK